MDPLSVSASVAGLVSLADTVFQGIFKCVKVVKGAKKEIATPSAEDTTLFGILTSLHLVIAQVEEDALITVARTHHIFACQRTLEKINGKLAQHTPGINHTIKDSSWEPAKIKLRWPFSKQEIDKLINHVELHKATLTLALTADGMTSILKTLSRQKCLSKRSCSLQG